MNKIYIFLFTLLSSVYTLQSQNNAFLTSNETFSIHTNNSVFVTGESLYYSVFIKNTQDTLTSKIIYVALVNKDLTSIQQEKIVENGNASGDIFLNTNLKSGVYKLIAYTKKSLLQDKNNFSEKEISIINPYQTNTQFFLDKIKANNNLIVSHPLIKGKTEFGKREKIVVQLPEFTDQKTSVSVRKVNSFCLNSASYSATQSTKKSIYKQPQFNTLPEVRGKIISGHIENYQKKSETDDYISLSTLENDIQTKIAKVSPEGQFFFLFDEPMYESQLLLQPLSGDGNIDLAFDSTRFDYDQLNWNTSLTLSTNKRNEIDARAVANQIDIAYYNSKKDTISQSSSSSYFYYPNYNEVNLNDYTRFKTIEEIVVELLPPVRIKKKEGKNNIFILNKETNPNLDFPALVLVNGVIVQDVDQLLKINAQKIEKVHYLRDKYYLGANLYDGFINFISKENLLDANFSPYQLIQNTPVLKNKKYYKEDYSNDLKLRIPDQRYQLYWNPDSSSNEQFSFYTSDITGQFEIEITTTNTEGKEQKTYQYFTVKE